MSLHTALAVSAFVASAVLLATSAARLLPSVAIAASGVEVLMAFGVLRIAAPHLPLAPALGAALALPGAIALYRATGKVPTAAATVVALVGLVQLGVFVAARA